MARHFPNFVYLRGWTWDKLSEVKKYGKIDILYIDSWHEYDYFARDWNDYAPLLSEESILLVDDLQNPGVLKGFKEIPGRDRLINFSMNPAIPFGVTLQPDRRCVLPFKRQDFMP
jgi:hypothetical protein